MLLARRGTGNILEGGEECVISNLGGAFGEGRCCIRLEVWPCNVVCVVICHPGINQISSCSGSKVQQDRMHSGVDILQTGSPISPFCGLQKSCLPWLYCPISSPHSSTGPALDTQTLTQGFLFFLDLFILCARVSHPHVYMCTTYMPGACGGQKRVLDPSKIELQMFASYHVSSGKQTSVLCKNNKCFNSANSPAPGFFLFKVGSVFGGSSKFRSCSRW